MTTNPELQAEQAYIDRAYACLARTRNSARNLVDVSGAGPGGTFQARYERDVMAELAANRLAQTELGDQSLCFGRIDRADGDTFYIGRIAVSDEESEPVVVDWRAQVAEPFYRATGRDPMGLERRRHFASQGRVLRGIDDELFGDATHDLDRRGVVGEGALISALNQARSGRLSDIVATIQSEQDEVIRAPLPGVLVVQGGPGTGKTVVALHRAAYLLYTHRFPLEGQGVLVLGPNRLFLGYIEQVLPSLGEAGVEVAVLADLVPDTRAMGVDPPAEARLKGDLRMCRVLRRAVRGRQRPLPRTVAVPYGVERLRVTPDDSAELIAFARRRARTHNAGRKFIDQALFSLLASKMRDPLDAAVLRSRIRSLPETREILERIWPVLTPAQLLNDLFGSRALLRLASRGVLSEREVGLLLEPRVDDPSSVVWSTNDVPLLDEALELLGPRPRHRVQDAIRTYGHIVVDEAQDLSPMELRVIDRRSLNGSMTIVGDIAQATSAAGHASWDEILEHLPDRHAPRRAELAIGYRLPAPSMALAARLLAVAAPGLAPPRSVRESGAAPVVEPCTDFAFDSALAAAVRREVEAIDSGSVAVVCASSWLDRVEAALVAGGIDFGQAHRGRFDHQITVVPVGLAKGLELDACIVVEPGAILDEEFRGPQSLYVALTRATKRLSLLHVSALPDVLRDDEPAGTLF
ncbi:MAG TPA: AAA family ATPase [Microthrixaceae bacterium]|nr:AAA family ATPase [Microthrixaceae bacterium]HMT25546.1 AAA family ATPase [Microthrixaceae bacterium]